MTKHVIVYFLDHPLLGNVYIITDTFLDVLDGCQRDRVIESNLIGKHRIVQPKGDLGMLTYQGRKYVEISKTGKRL